MLELSDPRWGELRSTYGNGASVVPQLAALKGGNLSKEKQSILWQEFCHEYESTEVGYAAVPHLVQMSEASEGDQAIFLLGVSAYVVACAQRHASNEIPEFLRSFLDDACERAIQRIALLLPEVRSSTGNVKSLTYIIAAFLRDAPLFFAIEGLDSGFKCPNCGEVVYQDLSVIGFRGSKE